MRAGLKLKYSVESGDMLRLRQFGVAAERALAIEIGAELPGASNRGFHVGAEEAQERQCQQGPSV